jgi:hypothetical protein
MNNKTGGKLIGTGSSSCVFRPNLPCKNKKVEISKDLISKLFLRKPQNLEEEIKFNEIIDKLKNSDIFAITMSKLCMSENYEDIKKYEPDIDKCLKDNGYSNLSNKDMLYGQYGGVSMETRVNELFTKDVFNNPETIKKTMNIFMKECYSLFYGLSIMYLNNILQFDIKPDNIVYHDGKFKFIDFGISTTFSDIGKIKSRALDEFSTDRIYIYYPFELIYAFPNTIQLYMEKINYRDNYNYVKDIHDILFYRNFDESTQDILDLSIDGKLNDKIISQRLDIYSLGITISQLILEKIIQFNKDLQKNQMIDKIQDIFCDNSMYPYTELLYKMTEPLSNNRITPIMALSELKEILNYNPSYEKQSKKTIKKKSR